MALFSSKMTPDQLAKVKGKTQTANHLAQLAIEANSHGVTRVQQRKARAELERAVGRRKADKLQEDALRQAGARPKGLARFFG